MDEHIVAYRKTLLLVNKHIDNIHDEEIELKLPTVIDNLEKLYRLGEKLYGYDVIRDAGKVLSEVDGRDMEIGSNSGGNGDFEANKTIQINILNALTDKVKRIE